jgi:hypothetical protein
MVCPGGGPTLDDIGILALRLGESLYLGSRQ